MNRKAELAARRQVAVVAGWLADCAGLWPGNAGRSHDCCVMVTRMPLAAADGCCWTSMAGGWRPGEETATGALCRLH